MAAGPAGGSGGAMTAWVLNLLTDLAFNLLIFFVVCASTAPENGRPQQVPGPKKDAVPEKRIQNVEISITRTTVSVDGKEVPLAELRAKLAGLLTGKTTEQERIVEVKSAKDTPYSQWIRVTGAIEEAGGVILLQLEDVKEIPVK